MTLTVEDGSQVTGANTYVTDLEYTTYATAHGLTVGSDAPTREIELLNAMVFIESHRRVFRGLKVSKDQAVQWPRTAVWVDSFPINADEIPEDLKNAQIEAAVATRAIGLLKTTNNQNVKRQKVDVLELEFFSGGSWENARADRVDVFLNVLLRNSALGMGALVIRA